MNGLVEHTVLSDHEMFENNASFADGLRNKTTDYTGVVTFMSQTLRGRGWVSARRGPNEHYALFRHRYIMHPLHHRKNAEKADEAISLVTVEVLANGKSIADSNATQHRPNTYVLGNLLQALLGVLALGDLECHTRAPQRTPAVLARDLLVELDGAHHVFGKVLEPLAKLVAVRLNVGHDVRFLVERHLRVVSACNTQRNGRGHAYKCAHVEYELLP